MAINDYLIRLVPDHKNVNHAHLGTQTLVTSRLVLTRLTPEDASNALLWATDADSYVWDSKIPFSQSQLSDFIATLAKAYEDPRTYYWAIHPRLDVRHPVPTLDGDMRREGDVTYSSRSVGVLYVNSVMSFNTSAEIDFLLNKSYWSFGYMREAICSVLDFLFYQVGFHRVSVRLRIDAKPGVRMLRQLSFREDGLLREYYPDLTREDSWIDALIYSILCYEWEHVHPSPGA